MAPRRSNAGSSDAQTLPVRELVLHVVPGVGEVVECVEPRQAAGVIEPELVPDHYPIRASAQQSAL